MKIKVFEKLPSAIFFFLDEKKIVQKINLSSLFENQKVILIGVPGAFTNICSTKHLPGYVTNFKKKKKKRSYKNNLCFSE